ncbi:MAG: hypothetical protein H6Q89_1946, partial [Myxococcaceae bacterium]|nr:hypothetical protein [Myxococcaceae bacterium]
MRLLALVLAACFATGCASTHGLKFKSFGTYRPAYE